MNLLKTLHATNSKPIMSMNSTNMQLKNDCKTKQNQKKKLQQYLRMIR